MPKLSELLLFKIIGQVYPTSDLKHFIASPALLLMSQYLVQGLFNTGKDVFKGLFIAQMLYHYTLLSKRYSPELACFLTTVVQKCLKGVSKKPLLIVPEFKRMEADLAVRDFSQTFKELDASQLFANDFELDDSLRLGAMTQAFLLVSQMCRNTSDTTAIVQVFSPAMTLLQLALEQPLDGSTKKRLEAYRTKMDACMAYADQTRRPLQLQKRKAQAIKSYMPKFDKNYSADRRSRDPDRDRAAESKLKAEFKKEHKGALRELRRDAQFIGQARLEKQKQKDVEYKKKMDKIMGQLAEQEGAMRGYERELKKARRK